MPADPAAVKSIFLEAVELPIAARAALLAERCGADADLLRRVLALLSAHDQAGEGTGTASFADVAETADRPGKDEHVGAILAGKYKLIEAIGDGGMGSVFLAQQTEPVKRAVAVKVIKAGMDSKAVLARFEAERQALALMDHPNIARVLDAGTTDSGRPFFVMELVKGVPITQYCDERKLTPKQRLELFVPVCHAIQHAHQKGVIHRDIKPSNVLVALYDDRPVPKVIDFGIAKAAGQTLTAKTLMTGFGAVVGTPEYMSPEQASLNNLDVDTRSDVYSLGVLLYELLTGSTPVDKKSLGKAALLEVLRIVREVEAPKPSAKLSTMATLPSVAANRGTEPTKLSKLMKGELDWLVLKALEKDRTHRYETANGFAADVQRYLSGEPVQAVPPSASYRLRKFVKRHKARVIGAAAFLLVLVISVVVSSWFAVLAKQAQDVAEEKRREAEENADFAFDQAMTTALTQLELMEEKLLSDQMVESLQVDLDLIEIRTDPRVGLLRLARPRKEGRALSFANDLYSGKFKAELTSRGSDNVVALREFVTAAVLAGGQRFAPLLPPITHDGQAVLLMTLSPDGKTCLTIGADGTARLWESRTAKPLAILRDGTERIVQAGFSPDGMTIYTCDTDSVSRFWNSADGAFRAITKLSPNRYVYPDDVALQQLPFVAPTANRVAMNDTRALTQGHPVSVNATFKKGDDLWSDGPCRPAELWNTATGRLIARFDHPGSKSEDCRFANNGKWIATVQKKSQVVLFSAEDGHEIGRLVLPRGEEVWHFDVSPNGHRILTQSRTTGAEPTYHQRFWEPNPWRIVPDPVLDPKKDGNGIYFLTDHLVTIHTGETILYRIGEAESKTSLGDDRVETRCDGELLVSNDDRIFDGKTLKRLVPPTGRKYHPSFARLAPDGRFVLRDRGAHAIDTVTEKPLEFLEDWGVGETAGNFHEWGTVAVGRGCELRIFPSRNGLDLPPKLLELWAQVAVRGELGEDGAFVKWDEPTWEKKRQELAGFKPPHPDFPFPGYVAADKLHWLRAEFGEAKSEADQLRLAATLLRRAEESGDKTEAVRWREEVRKRTRETLPPPRRE